MTAAARRWLALAAWLWVPMVLLCTPLLRAHAQSTTDIMILPFDAGETMGLLPAALRLRSSGMVVSWAPLTPWTQRVLARENVAALEAPRTLSAMPHIEDRQNEADISHWVALVRERQPRLIVVGLVSSIQRQLAKELRRRGFYVAGFYDGFDALDRNSVIWQVAQEVNEVWAPTNRIAAQLQALGLKSVKALGQPSLEAWYRQAIPASRTAALDRLQIPEGADIVLFAGQYGEGYAELLDRFLTATLEELTARANLHIILSPHPRTQAETELAALARFRHPRLRLAPTGMTTAEIAAVSRVITTWKSTVGVQAAFMGKPVIYFLMEGDDYENELTSNGVAFVARAADFSSMLARALATRNDPGANRRRLADIGYIPDADQRIAAEMRLLVAQQRRKR